MVSQSNKDDLKRQGDDMADQSTEMVKSGTDSAKNATNGVLDSAKQSLDNTVPPQDRQQIWESAKKSPLAYVSANLFHNLLLDMQLFLS